MPPNDVNHEAVEATAAAWLARKDDTRNWTEKDEQQLEAWLSEHTAHQVAWLRMEYAWKRADRLRPLREALAPAQELKVPASLPAVRTFSFGRRRAAASIFSAFAVVVGASIAWQSARTPTESQYVTAVGARQTLALSDGSRVTLNTRTRAHASLKKDQRSFWLDEGEAFFEVQHDPAHPFVVNAGKDRVTVLGTKFSVRHENGKTWVTVLEGRVRLDQSERESVIATPSPVSTLLVKNDSAIAQPGGVLVSAKTSTQTLQDLSWREGRLEFDNRSLIEIAAEFNRYNRRQLVIHGDAAEIKLSGRFETYNVDGFVRLIKAGFDVTVREDGEFIHLSSS